MDRAELIEALRKYDAVLRENGATGLFLFGSRARGTNRPDSDLDLFIDFDPAEKVPNPPHAARRRDLQGTWNSRHHNDQKRPSSRDEEPRCPGCRSGSVMAKDPVVAVRDCLAEIALLHDVAGHMTLEAFKSDPIVRACDSLFDPNHLRSRAAYSR